jgi:cell division protein FtsQ
MTQVIDTPVVEKEPVAIDPRILERREEVSRQRSRRRLRIAAVVGAVVVLVSGIWFALHSPVLAARHVTVVGAIRTGVGPVVAAVGLHGQPLVDVNPGQVAARVDALPWVAHATVTRHWPDTITVTVDERVPAAVVDTPGHGAVLVDRHGRVLSTETAVTPGTVVLAAPVVPGRPGSVLGPGATPGLSVLAAVPPLLQSRLEQIDVADNGDVSLSLTGRIGVTMGPAVELPAKFEALVSVLVDVPPTQPEVVDVTVPDAPAVGPPTPPAESSGTPPPAPPAPTVGQASRAPQTRQTRRGPS